MIIPALFVGLVLVFIFSKSYKVIPARRVAVQERFGQFHRIIYPGVHFVIWPFDTLKTVHWSYIDQNNRTVVKDTDLISTQICQMDIPPIKCICKDRVKVTVDATVFYNIVDVRKAVYDSDDTLNRFYQRVIKALHQVVKDVDNENLFFDEIGESICKIVNAEEGPIQLERFDVQEKNIDDTKVVEINEEIYAQTRAKEVNRTHYDLEMDKLEHERKVQAARIEMELDLAKAEAEKRKLEWEGLTFEQRLELERARGLNAIAAAGVEKVVFAPYEHWTKSPNFFQK